MAKANSSILEVKNLHVSFGKSDQQFNAVKGVSFNLKMGETLGILGESGSGKSVTALSILRLLPYPLAHHPHGKILFEGEDLLQSSSSRMQKVRGNEISMIFQEPMTSLNPLHTLEKQISEVLILHQGILREEERRKKIIELMKLVGFHDGEQRLSSYPHQLSGGQRQRVMIAMAVASRPKILLADEPTTAVDVTTQAAILALLQDLQKKFGMSLILISHDLNVVHKMADRILVMQNGQIVEEGSVKTVFAKPKDPYTKTLLRAEPSGKAIALKKSARNLIKVNDLQVNFSIKHGLLQKVVGTVKAVDHVSFELREGETLGIVGESGSGKTTLAMAILGLQQYTGRVHFEGNSITDLSNKALRSYRRFMQLVFQDPFGSLSPRLSVSEIIGEGLEVHEPTLSKNEREKRISQSLKEVGLDERTRHRYPHEFSGGQRQRIAIARAIILKPKLVVLDEPTSALDRAIQKEILDLLRALQKAKGLSYLFISHDLKVVRSMSHHIMVMHKGKVVEFGATEALFQRPKHAYTKTLLKAALDLEINNHG